MTRLCKRLNYQRAGCQFPWKRRFKMNWTDCPALKWSKETLTDWISAIVVTTKSVGLCIDPRPLNQVLHRNQYHLPTTLRTLASSMSLCKRYSISTFKAKQPKTLVRTKEMASTNWTKPIDHVNMPKFCHSAVLCSIWLMESLNGQQKALKFFI